MDLILQVDPSQWSLIDWISKVPMNFWIGLIAGLVAIFVAIFSFVRWIYKTKYEVKIQNLENDLEELKKKPENEIQFTNKSSSLNSISDFLKYSFVEQNFIHPGIIEELEGWLSDTFSVIAALDLDGAMQSNRYTEEINLKILNQKKFISKTSSSGEEYLYNHLGKTKSGIHILHTIQNTTGSGVFHSVLFVVLESDEIINKNQDDKKTRIIIKSLGAINLGDRFEGNINFDGEILTLGTNRSNFGQNFENPARIRMS